MNAEKILPVRELQPRLECIDTLRPATGPLPMPKVRRTKEDKIVRATKREVRFAKRLISAALITTVAMCCVTQAYIFRGSFGIGGEVFAITLAGLIIPGIVDSVERWVRYRD